MALFTAAETYFFNESIMEQRYIVAPCFGLFWSWNFRVSYIMGKIVGLIDDHFKGRSSS